MGADHRHLILGAKAEDLTQGLVTVACTQDATPVAYDRHRHTYLVMATTCPDCLAVNEAWQVAFRLDLELRGQQGG